jgi:conjugative relaxase-like TrwC/TraI family protein
LLTTSLDIATIHDPSYYIRCIADVVTLGELGLTRGMAATTVVAYELSEGTRLKAADLQPLRRTVHVPGLRLADGREAALDQVVVLREGRRVAGYQLKGGLEVAAAEAMRVTLTRRRIAGYQLSDGREVARDQVRTITAAEVAMAFIGAGGQDVPSGSVAIRDPQTGRLLAYYSDRGDAPGRWVGLGATEVLGLTGLVSVSSNLEQYNRLMAGLHPETGKSLTRGQPGGERVAGFDLLWASPKSVSMLYGLSPRWEVRERITGEWEASVEAALAWLERETAWARRGHVSSGPGDPYPDTSYYVPTTGLVGVNFTHRATRPEEGGGGEDPHLHTHLTLVNMAFGEDGHWSALDANAFYHLAKTAAFIQQSDFRARLSLDWEHGGLGIQWTQPQQGHAEIRGLDNRDWIEAFSRRSQEVEEELIARGIDPSETSHSAVRDQAGHDTRQAKESGRTTAELVAEWQARGAELGLGPAQIEAVIGRGHPGPDQLTPKIAERLARQLTEQENVFSAAEAIAVVAGSSTQGIPVERAVELGRELTHGATDEIVPLGRVQALGRHDFIRLANGRKAPIPAALRGEAGERYTTREVLRLEREVVQGARQRRAVGVGIAQAGAIAAALAAHPKLGEDQVAMVVGLTTDGAGVSLVLSPAGHGKTTALQPATEAWKAGGAPVIATAHMAARAEELGEGVGIEARRSMTIASLRLRVEGTAQYGGTPLPDGVVVLVDEVSMVDLRDLAALQRHVAAVRGKLVLVGDEAQLGSIGPSAPLRELPKYIPAYELVENRRQVEEWERDAISALRRGQVGEAVAAYDQQGRIVYAEGGSRQARAALIAQAAAEYLAIRADGKSVVLMAATHKDRRALNAPIRAELIRQGEVAAEGMTVGKLEVAVGDVLQVQKNSYKLGLKNSHEVTVEAIDPERGTTMVRRRDGDSVELPKAYLAKHCQYGYAQTVHKAEGGSWAEGLTLADRRALSSQWGNTALTRGAIKNKVFFIGPSPVDPEHHQGEELAPGREQQREQIVAGLTRDRSKELATEAVAPTEEQRRDQVAIEQRRLRSQEIAAEVIVALERGDRLAVEATLSAAVASTQARVQKAAATQAQAASRQAELEQQSQEREAAERARKVHDAELDERRVERGRGLRKD